MDGQSITRILNTFLPLTEAQSGIIRHSTLLRAISWYKIEDGCLIVTLVRDDFTGGHVMRYPDWSDKAVVFASCLDVLYNG